MSKYSNEYMIIVPPVFVLGRAEGEASTDADGSSK